MLFLSNIWRKNGLQPLRYVRGAMEDMLYHLNKGYVLTRAVPHAYNVLSGRELAGVALRSSEKGLESLDSKRLASCIGLAIALYVLLLFFPLIPGTFILGYVTNFVVQWVSKLTAGHAPRQFVVGVFYAFIITVISGLSLMTIPTVVREGQYFISTIQSENPYVYVGNTMRKVPGNDLTTKLEAYVMASVEMPEAAAKGTLKGKPALLTVLGSRKHDSDVWTEARSRRLGIVLQKRIRSYFAATITLITRLLGASTKVIFKAVLSLIFSFMTMWDLPIISCGIKRSKTSRLSFAYELLTPVVTKFGSVAGKSFEAEGLIAIVNTALTSAGLFVLSIPGVGFLSVVTMLCSFIPVAEVFVSTLPMCIIALSEYGVVKAVAVIVMVILLHLIEAYMLNPQIYSAHLHLHPSIVLVVLYISEHSYGIPGLLMAVPVALHILRTIMTDDSEQSPQNRSATVLGEQSQAVTSDTSL